MTAAKSRINFFNFSPEVRNTIYETVFSEHIRSHGNFDNQILVQDVDMALGDDNCHENVWVTVRGKHMQPPPLLQTSQQVRAETQAFYYGSNTFFARLSEDPTEMELEGPTAARVCEWLAQLGPATCALIKDLVIDVEDVYIKDLKENIMQSKPKQPKPAPRAAPKLRTTVSHILEYYGMDKYGVQESAFKIQCGTERFDEPEYVSSTELFCTGCGRSGQPDEKIFRGGVCECYTRGRQQTESRSKHWDVLLG